MINSTGKNQHVGVMCRSLSKQGKILPPEQWATPPEGLLFRPNEKRLLVFRANPGASVLICGTLGELPEPDDKESMQKLSSAGLIRETGF